MTQHYIGVKQVEAWPQPNARGEPGYAVKYSDGYVSWSPQDVFEVAYLSMGGRQTYDDDGVPVTLVNDNTVTRQMVDAFLVAQRTYTLGEKTTVVHVTLANGFEMVESSSCVDPANYDEKLGAEICLERIRNQVWSFLGFTLQWARTGLTRPNE